MAGKVRKLDFYPDEYVSGVAGVLNAQEQGVYWMICALIMSEGGPIPNNEKRIAMLCGIRPAAARKLIGTLTELDKIWITSDGKLAQKRSLSEIEKATKRIESASENGQKGGRPSGKNEQNQQNEKAVGLSPGSESEKLTTNHQPVTSNRKRVASPSARGTRLPDNWWPNDAEREYARSYGVDPKATAQNFRDYWQSKPGSGARKTDWTKAWQTWVRGDAEKKAQRPGRADKQENHGVTTTDYRRWLWDRRRNRWWRPGDLWPQERLGNEPQDGNPAIPSELYAEWKAAYDEWRKGAAA